MTTTFESDELFEAAYKSELVLARRLARKTGVSDAQALREILEASAGTLSLAELCSQRAAKRHHVQRQADVRRAKKTQAAEARRVEKQPQPNAWLAWFDGATNPNPGRMGIGGMLKSPAGKTIEISHAAGHGDSNEAEYLALIAVLESALTQRPDHLVVYGDSKVVIDDMNGAGAPCFARLRTRAMELTSQLKMVSLLWVPRRKNAMADGLSQRAIGIVSGP